MSNLFNWYNCIIIIVFIVDALLFVRVLRLTEKAHNTTHLTSHITNAPEKDSRSEKEESASGIIGRLNQWYSFFSNTVAVFPLLGMLGTVISLYNLAGDLADTTTSFFSALSSTIWGIVFAIIGKCADAFIAPKVEAENKAYDLLVERNSNERKTEAAK